MASLLGAEIFHGPGDLELILIAGAAVPENQDLQPFGLDGLIRYRKGKIARKHYVQRVFLDRFTGQGYGRLRERAKEDKDQQAK